MYILRRQKEKDECLHAVRNKRNNGRVGNARCRVMRNLKRRRGPDRIKRKCTSKLIRRKSSGESILSDKREERKEKLVSCLRLARLVRPSARSTLT